MAPSASQLAEPSSFAPETKHGSSDKRDMAEGTAVVRMKEHHEKLIGVSQLVTM